MKTLVDTGAKIPLVFRKGLLASKSLRKATFPVHFSMVDGQRMEGGTHGIFVELQFPVYREGRLINAKTVKLFAYEADIRGIDVIVGYPFLKVTTCLWLRCMTVSSLVKDVQTGPRWKPILRR